MNTIGRFLTILLLVYLIYAGVVVTAVHPQVTPVTMDWARLVALKIVTDLRWAFRELAQLWASPEERPPFTL